MKMELFTRELDNWSESQLTAQYAIIMHDLKNCLSVITYYGSVITCALVDPHEDNNKRIINAAIAHIQQLTQTYLDCSAQMNAIKLRLSFSSVPKDH